MKKFIILLISLFLGVFISSNTHVDKKVKNDITKVAVCTNTNVDVISAEEIDINYSPVSTGSDIYYYLTGVSTSNNHSTVLTNSIKLYMPSMVSYISNTLATNYDVIYLPNTKDVGLAGIMNRSSHFNIYLYHFINKLGQT
jgi:hypothetical protein